MVIPMQTAKTWTDLCSDVGKQEPRMTPARFSALFAVAVLNTLDYTEIG